MKRFLSLTICFVLTVVLLLSSVGTAFAESITLTTGASNVEKDIPAGEWICPNCNNLVTGNFCNNCGTAKPENIVNDLQSSENDDIIGTWYAIQTAYNGVAVDITGTGLHVTMQLNADGSAIFSTNGTEEEVTWTRIANTIIITTDDSSTVKCFYADGKITLKGKLNDTIFSKELTVTDSVFLPAPINATSEDQFFGTWTISRIAVAGIVFTSIELAAMGYDEDITFSIDQGEARAEIVTDGRPDYNEYNTTFSNGKLQLKSKKTDVIISLVLTDSGELIISQTSDGLTRQIYFKKEEAETPDVSTEN